MKIVEVNSSNFKKEVLKSKKVLVDFNADWCGPCRMLRPILEEVAKENDDYKIVSINVDNAEDLAREYGIMSIPCLILFKDGKEMERSVGLVSKGEIINILEEK